jgi:hypothetical protein
VVDATSFEGLFGRVARLDEVDMRVGLICERLESLRDEDAVRLLDEAYQAAVGGGAQGQLVFLASGWALFDPRVEPRRPDFGAAARDAGLHQVADFVAPPTDDEAALQDKRRVPDFGRGRPLTLGERKSLARTHDRSLIQRVVRDPHPDVVRILLDNPSLTEEDVVRICAARPNHSSVLQTVYRHRRWVVQYRPRNAIVRNPDTPLDTALLLAPLLRKSELKEAATSSELTPVLRLSCRTIVETRAARREPSLKDE